MFFLLAQLCSANYSHLGYSHVHLWSTSCQSTSQGDHYPADNSLLQKYILSWPLHTHEQFSYSVLSIIVFEFLAVVNKYSCKKNSGIEKGYLHFTERENAVWGR